MLGSSDGDYYSAHDSVSSPIGFKRRRTRQSAKPHSAEVIEIPDIEDGSQIEVISDAIMPPHDAVDNLDEEILGGCLTLDTLKNAALALDAATHQEHHAHKVVTHGVKTKLRLSQVADLFLPVKPQITPTEDSKKDLLPALLNQDDALLRPRSAASHSSKSPKKKKAALFDDFFAMAPERKRAKKRKTKFEDTEADVFGPLQQSPMPDSPAGTSPIVPPLPSPDNIILRTEYTPPHTGHRFDSKSEDNRMYRLHITCRVSAPTNSDAEFDIDVVGNYRFALVLTHEVLPRLNEVLKPRLFALEQVALIWVEGKTEIKPFFKPSTLRIERVAQLTTILTMLVIPKENDRNFVNQYPEFADDYASSSHILQADVDPETSDINISDDDEQSHLGMQSGASLDMALGKRLGGASVLYDKINGDPEDAAYFVIGLKGNDNKRIEVMVCPTTRMRNVLEYYVRRKKVTPKKAKKARLVFDDEIMVLDQCVGDTELEEEFEVQVVLP